MSFLTGRKVTMEDQVKQNRDAIRTAQKEIDKELFRLEFENKQLANQIRSAAQKDQGDIIKIHAKTLVRNRKSIKRFITSKANLQCLGLRMLSISTMQQMTKAMSQSATIMTKLNDTLKIPEMAKMMAQFSKEMQKLDDKQNMMEEMMDDVFEEEGEAMEIDMEVNNVVAEVCNGLNIPGITQKQTEQIGVQQAIK
ncbi:Vacuolar_protein sorting 2 [Hexamita inflata]|uniref:Vacuolar protein sorting 2 n=1 Tax=Hexamita inflata TaxID=28002 RepID=A0AA86TYP9_9EUKA|nr:Vacuolar protein sorting 2 [Hexamita inflata]